MKINQRHKIKDELFGNRYEFVPGSLNPAGNIWTIRDIACMLWPGSNALFLDAVLSALEVKGSWVPLDVVMPTGDLDHEAKCRFLLEITKGMRP